MRTIQLDADGSVPSPVVGNIIDPHIGVFRDTALLVRSATPTTTSLGVLIGDEYRLSTTGGAVATSGPDVDVVWFALRTPSTNTASVNWGFSSSGLRRSLPGGFEYVVPVPAGFTFNLTGLYIMAEDTSIDQVVDILYLG